MTPRRILRSALAALALALIVQPRIAPLAYAQPAVFAGDPTDASGRPWIVLPGVPLVHWGPDERWQTGDDIIDPSIVGDVDLVVRSGGGFVAGSETIPPPASDVASAPGVVAGGLHFPSTGDEVAFDAILSDGAPSPPAGHPLATSDLDGRGVFVAAFPDLDGDGFIGPTNADSGGSADNRIERQEAIFIAGRRLAVLEGGVASGTLAVSLGLPASTGGLGLVLAGGAITGESPPTYDDGPWIATLLPAMWPLSNRRIIGNNPRPPDPFGLVDVEIETERQFRPAPNHAILGTPYAIPLDGSSVTNDLVRAVSGPVASVTVARALSPTTFDADAFHRILPAIAAGGTRRVVDPVQSVQMADNGPGQAVGLIVFPADLLGNQADPGPEGTSIGLEVSANLRIVSPDADGDPSRETILFAAADLVDVTLDDAGQAADGAPVGQLLTTLDGEPAGAVRVNLSGAATPTPTPTPTATPSPTPVATATPVPEAIAAGLSVVRNVGVARGDVVRVEATLAATLADLDPQNSEFTIALRDESGGIYTRTIPAGSLSPNQAGTVYRYKETVATSAGRVVHLVVRRAAAAAPRVVVRWRVVGLDLLEPSVATSSMTTTIELGPRVFASTWACRANVQGTMTRCQP